MAESPVASVNVVLLSDDVGMWERILDVIAGQVGVLDGGQPGAGGAIGIVTWRRATRREVAQLPSLRERHHGPLVAILSELPSTRGSRAVAARVEGSIIAGTLELSLLPTLRAVAVDQCVVPRAVRQLVDRPPLSPRERQVLAMVVLDFSNAEIAQKLFVTESSVKSHLTSAFNKIGVTSRSAAAELILDNESGLGPGILRISPEEES